ncbi:MAG: site-2 protease family protein [Sedimentisphaerales bacterium]|nr:site-2 protease family protein [Sedimentisphaerales bacterium]
MSEQNRVVSKNFTNTLILLVIIAAVIYLVTDNFEKSSSIILSFVGLGFVIFVHELGHFVSGKLCDINVEAFAIGFGPVVIGIKKVEGFLQIRILPTMIEKANDPDKLGLLCVRIPIGGKAGETEYQLRIFPIGGFVKLLGQEDVGADKPSDDPRSFVNKPIWKRIVVAAAGVTFNIILAGIFFVIVFTVGINMPPAVIGDIMEGFPADKAGLHMGDEILEVNGESGIDFSGMAIAAALSNKGEPVQLKVKRREGAVEDVTLVARELPGAGYKGFGVLRPISTEIAKVQSPDELYVKTGLKPGDVLTAIDGEKVEEYWQYGERLKRTFAPSVRLTFQRPGQDKPVVKEFKTEFTAALKYEDGNDFALSHIYGLIPRLEISSVNAAASESLQSGDIIIQAGDIVNPTYEEIRTITKVHADKELGMTVLRKNELVETTIVPKKGTDGRVVIGIGVGLDTEHAIVAKVSNVDMPGLAALPRGAKITYVAEKEVANYFDIFETLKENRGKTVRLGYSDEFSYGEITLAVPLIEQVPATKAILIEELPFRELTRLYRADGTLDAVAMGSRKTVEFIAQTYMTLKGLIVGSVSHKSLMGPVGMIAASSKIISEKDIIQYLHFMGIIGACLAVMNFLPLPILDGGLIVLLIIEKVKGSPVHIKIQEGLTYAGLAVIGVLFVLITYNDIIRVFFSK